MKKIITQIGSLPFGCVRDALDYSWRHDVPFLPELTRKNETMFEYIKNPGNLSCLNDFKNVKYFMAKIQCVGPATLIENGFSEGDAMKSCYFHISSIMDGLKANRKLLFLDEPVLENTKLDYRALWDVLLYDFDAIKGVHTCGNANWDELFDSNLDIISFDATKYDFGGERNGKRIAWGVEKLDEIKDFQEGDLLTLPCGMSHLKYDIDDCEKNLEKLVEIKKELLKA